MVIILIVIIMIYGFTRSRGNCMPYHVFASVKDYPYFYGDYDLDTEEEVLKNYCIPYIEGKSIVVKGAKLTDEKIKELVIFLSDLSSIKIFRETSNKVGQMNCFQENKAMKESTSAYDITSDIMKTAKDSIGGNIKTSRSQSSSINISGSTFNNSPVTGVMDNSTVNITVNKLEIEGWLQQVIEELEKNNVQNEELKSTIDTLSTALQDPKSSGIVIKNIVEGIKTIGFNILSSAIWLSLMNNLPIR